MMLCNLSVLLVVERKSKIAEVIRMTGISPPNKAQKKGSQS
ncbi:hypothetical protein [Psychrobacter sp. LV10R520-6]|nr:hypothetical protein [Psychrobacter sp. LV10R520-6]SNT70425.1 hypothetical protein SAMN04488491_1591 [Psychrobacter sp. LV10R520-6]